MRTLHRIAVPVTLPSGHMSLSVTLVPEGCSNTHFNLILKAVFVFLTTACTQPSSKTALSCPLHLPVIPTQGPLASFCLLLINAPCPGLLSQPDYYLWRPPIDSGCPGCLLSPPLACPTQPAVVPLSSLLLPHPRTHS